MAVMPKLAKEIAESTGKVFQFCISDGSSPAYFLINLKDVPSCSFSRESREADCTLTMNDVDYMSMAAGQLDGMTAFMEGKLQITGDMLAAQDFEVAVGRLRKAVEEQGGKNATAEKNATTAESDDFPTDIKASEKFRLIRDGMAVMPKLAKEIAESTGKVFQFCISDGSSPAYFLINLKDVPSCSFSRESREADCTLTMNDVDYMSMAAGQLDGMSAFMQGKLQIDGDMIAAQEFAPAMERLQKEFEARSKL
eukprot:276054_1